MVNGEIEASIAIHHSPFTIHYLPNK
jgi:hypothetical protein